MTEHLATNKNCFYFYKNSGRLDEVDFDKNAARFNPPQENDSPLDEQNDHEQPTETLLDKFKCKHCLKDFRSLIRHLNQKDECKKHYNESEFAELQNLSKLRSKQKQQSWESEHKWQRNAKRNESYKESRSDVLTKRREHYKKNKELIVVKKTENFNIKFDAKCKMNVQNMKEMTRRQFNILENYNSMAEHFKKIVIQSCKSMKNEIYTLIRDFERKKNDYKEKFENPEDVDEAFSNRETSLTKVIEMTFSDISNDISTFFQQCSNKFSVDLTMLDYKLDYIEQDMKNFTPHIENKLNSLKDLVKESMTDTLSN